MKNSGADLVVKDLGELTFDTATESGNKDKLLSALGEAQNIFKRLQKELPAIFLDYDGTLTPIVDDPAEAKLDERTREVLQRLTKDMFVAVISGRALTTSGKWSGSMNWPMPAAMALR